MSESAKNLSDIVEKLKEVDNIFKFGERMIPVIEGFVSFISEFIPFVEQISGSLNDSRSKIPEASNQISSVTNATELAMTEVLDKIDEISAKLLNMNESIDELVERRETIFSYASKLNEFIDDKPEAKEILNKLVEQNDSNLTLEIIKNNIREITVGTDQITMSLQVQDITAQQLASVNHLIVSVQHKLGELLDTVDSTGYKSDDNIIIDKLPDVHFDAKASYKPGEHLHKNTEGLANSEKASQEEIDKLFS